MDGEQYLRLLVERCIAAGVRAQDGGTAARAMRPFWTAQGALVAVESVTQETARTIDQDMRIAMALRHLRGAGVDLTFPTGPTVNLSFPKAPIVTRWAGPSRAADLVPCVVRSFQAGVDLGVGRLETSLVVWQASTATIVGKVRDLAPGPAQGNGSASGGLGLDAAVDFDDLVVRDDDGRRYRIGGWTGDASTDRWDVSLTLDPTPPDDVPALVIARAGATPTRAELRAAPEVDVRDRPVDDVPPGVRYLREQLERIVVLATGTDLAANLVDPEALAAIVAVGAVTEDEPLLEVVAGLERGTIADIADLPPPWPRIVEPLGCSDGFDAAVPLGVPISLPNRSLVVVESLLSEAEEFWVHWTTVHDQDRSLEPQRALRFTAQDDLGGCYVSRLFTGSGPGGILRGSHRFRPRLDPRASALELVASGRRGAAELSFRLPPPWGQS